MTAVTHSTSPEAPRIREFRQRLISSIPKIPNKRPALDALRDMRFADLLLVYLTWRLRFVPPKPRALRFWAPDARFQRELLGRPDVRGLLAKAEAGQDLTPHLSLLAHKNGFVLAAHGKGTLVDRWADKDMLLTTQGLHHFHIGEFTPRNPHGRSNELIIAEITGEYFTVIAFTDHRVFKHLDQEQMHVRERAMTYLQRDLKPDAFILYPGVMSSGHSLHLRMYSDWCERQIKEVDAQLGDPTYIKFLFAQGPQEMPPQTSFTWDFQDMTLGVLERESKTFFKFNNWDR